MLYIIILLILLPVLTVYLIWRNCYTGRLYENEFTNIYLQDKVHDESEDDALKIDKIINEIIFYLRIFGTISSESINDNVFVFSYSNKNVCINKNCYGLAVVVEVSNHNVFPDVIFFMPNSMNTFSFFYKAWGDNLYKIRIISLIYGLHLKLQGGA